MTPSPASPASIAARASRSASGAVTRLATMVVLPCARWNAAACLASPRSLGERRAAAAVHVHVDEAGQHPAPA